MPTTPTLWLAEQLANTSDLGPDGNNQREPQIVGLADGTFVVLWEDNSPVIDGDHVLRSEGGWWTRQQVSTREDALAA